MTRFAAPAMRRCGGGSIINIGSITGRHGGHVNLLYPTTKGAILNLPRTMAGQLDADGIRVNCIAPGFVLSDMGERMKKALGEELLLSGIPLGRAGQPEEIGKLAVFLASSDAAWITGKVYRIDGGAWM